MAVTYDEGVARPNQRSAADAVPVAVLHDFESARLGPAAEGGH